ncbi:MAG TPA: peptidylprolyl isomerase [Steroidobacteraceae bacterium]|nr:peptidylprolyl isomerase [Steroidobacteraceae bacterium]
MHDMVRGLPRSRHTASSRAPGTAKIPVSTTYCDGDPMRARYRTLMMKPFSGGLAITRAGLGGLLVLAAALACLLLIRPAAAADAPPAPNPQVRVTTNMGSFVIELRPDRAPLTVADFLHYVRDGFYSNTLFHRVVANFVVQGGGHAATDPYALKPTYPPVDNESGNGLQNKRGSVGLARAAGPHTGNAQFYINLVDNPELDPLPTRWGYAVFGQVVEGMDVIDRIGVVPTGTFGPFKSDAPLKPVIIQSVELVGAAQTTTPAPSPQPGAQQSGPPPAGTPPTQTPPSGSAQPGTPQPGSPPSSQPPASSPQPQPGQPGAPASTSPQPATPPPGTPPAPAGDKSQGTKPPPQTPPGEADQPPPI